MLTPEQRAEIGERVKFLMEFGPGFHRGSLTVAARVLLIEDDSRLAGMVQTYLGEAGYAVIRAADGRSGLERHKAEPFDLIVLDLMLPDIDGLEVCRTIRARADTPILMLTARGDAMDRVVGLEMGADDYLPKPFRRGYARG